MPKSILIAAALATITACAAAAGPSPAPAPLAHEAALPDRPAATPASHHAAVWCDVRETPTRNGVRFDAVAQSPYPARGDYSFIITRTDSSGSSDIEQGGGYDLAPDERAILGTAEISIGRGGRYRAVLVLDDGRETVCRQEVRS